MNLDTLFFLVKGDTKDAEQALTRVDKKADQTEKGLGKLGTGFGKLAGIAAGAVGGFMAVGFLKNQVMQTADEMNRLVEASERMGVDVGDLDAWSKSIADAGGSAEGFQGTLKSLAANIEMFKVKGTSRAHPFFQELGIDEGKVKNVMELLPQLADKFSQMSEQAAQGQGQKLGLDEVTIALLQKGRGEVEAMIKRQKELGTITKKDAEAIAQFDNTMDDLGRVMQGVWRMIVVGIVPAFSAMGEAITDAFLFVREHKGMVLAFIVAFAAIMGAVFMPVIWTAVAGLMTMAGAWIAAFWPIVLVVALVAALSAAIALLWDDFQTWIDGGDSLLGRHLGKWQDFKNKVVGWIDELKAKWDGFWDSVSDKWEKLKGFGVDLKTSAAEWTEHPIDQGAKVAGGLGEVFNLGNQAMDTANSTPLSAEGRVPGNTSKEQTNSVQTGPITINTQATDAGGVAQGLGDKLSSLMKDAMASFDDGVAA